jgi:ubiquinone/menaquinone biosynthesis C-methylase UbiE
MNYPTDKLSEVFRDTGGHLESSKIIIAHSTNKEDIREFALCNLNVKNAMQIIDLGCGFGFFTQALKNKINSNAIVTGIDCLAEYRQPFLKLCRGLGFNGQFYDSGTDALSNFKSASVDLVLSSFSIYFFPEIISAVASVLRKTGTFIIITHFSSHLHELTTMISEIFKDIGYTQPGPFPHDKLISNFPAEEGISRLSDYFAKIEKRDYENELVFTKESVDELMTYIAYKRSFFIPENIQMNPTLSGRFEKGILQKVLRKKEFRITKKDAIFICTHPLNN